jgi:hypothetical protein
VSCGWSGWSTCTEPRAPGSVFCSKHGAIKCSNCKTAPATHACSYASQFACDNPLCDACGIECPSHSASREPTSPPRDRWTPFAWLTTEEISALHDINPQALGALAAIDGEEGGVFQPSARGREMANELDMMRARYVLGLIVKRSQAELAAIAVAADAVESATSPNDPLAKLLRHLSAGLKP